jgi:pilus assembly protein CpaF
VDKYSCQDSQFGRLSYLKWNREQTSSVSELVIALSKRARKRIVDGGLELERALDQVLDQAMESELAGSSAAEEARLRQEMSEHLAAHGPLQPLLDDPEIEEIWINSNSEVFVATLGVSRRLDIQIEQELLQTLIEKMLRNTGRRLDRSTPFVDASLPDGSRLHVVIPDVTRNHWSINIRKFPTRVHSLQKLVGFGSLKVEQAKFLSDQVRLGKNILVSGATQAGKTTMLCALLDEVAASARIITVEETFEIRVEGSDWVAMQTRQPNLEGVGEISLRRLVKEALRMRPGRIVVGEVREAESFDLLIALNSGLPGLCTIHANSAKDAVAKLCTLPLLAGSNITSEFVNTTVGACIDFVVHCRMLPNGKRVVEEVASVSWDSVSERIEIAPVTL